MKHGLNRFQNHIGGEKPFATEILIEITMKLQKQR